MSHTLKNRDSPDRFHPHRHEHLLFCSFAARSYTYADMTETQNNSVGIVETQKIRIVESSQPLELACGKKLGPIDVAYETYGELNEAKDNAILICHALSGNAHVAGKNSINDEKYGWWESMVGPGKGIDTDKYFCYLYEFSGRLQRDNRAIFYQS